MKHDLERLAGLSQMILDDRLGILRRAAQARRQSQDQLAALDAGMPCQDDVPPLLARRVEMTYQRWADLRRMELNDVIARQTVTWIEAQAEARLAFGRNQALAGLVERQGKK